MRQRLSELSLIPEGSPKVAVGLGIIVLQADGRTELDDGLVRPALARQDGSEVVVRRVVVKPTRRTA